MKTVSFVGKYLVLFLVEGGLAIVPLDRVRELEGSPHDREAWEVHDDGARLSWPAFGWSVTVTDLLRRAVPL